MHDTGAPGEEAKFEVSDWHLKIILVTGVFMVFVAVVSFAICYVIMNSFERMEPVSDWKTPPLAKEHRPWEEMQGLRIQIQPWNTYADYAEASKRVSESYGIVSELQNGDTVYRIPISEAMRIVEETGFPQFQPLLEKIVVAPTVNER